MNIRKTIKFTVSLMFTYLLIGCSLRSNAAPAASPTDTRPPLQSPTLPVVDVTPITPTAILGQKKLKDIVFSSCSAISPGPPGGNQIPWTLLSLRGIIPYAIDPNTGVTTDQLLPDPDPNSNNPIADDFSISPDGKWLAYDLYEENNVSFVVEPSSNILTNSAKGRIIWHPTQPTGLEGWLTEKLVVLITYKDPNDFGSTLIRNPFNGQEHKFSLKEMPNAMDYQPGMSGMYLFAHSNLMPDPTLKRVVYPAVINHNEMATLWDVENKKVLTSLRLYLDQWFNDPLWSLGGDDFIIMAINDKEHVEWFQVTRDGAIQELTDFGEFLGDFKFEKPSRSWDGRYLAFQLIYNAGKDRKFLILDLKSPLLDGFCIDSVMGDGGALQPPVWAPDSRYVAITDGVNTENSWRVILVDVKERKAFQIGNDVDALGWIMKP